MDWLWNVLKGTSSSSSNLDGECFHRHEDSEPEDDDSLSAKNFDEENDIIGSNYYGHDGRGYYEDQNQTEDNVPYDDQSTYTWLYPEITEEELALSLQRSLHTENRLPFDDNITNYMLQPYPYSFPSAYRPWEQYGHNQIVDESFLNHQDHFWNQEAADHEFLEAHRHFKWSYKMPNPAIVCDVCDEPVPVDSYGNPKYEEVPVFLKYCRKHEIDGTAKCFSCERLQPRGTRYSLYPDGRPICGDCKKSAIMSRRDCQTLIDEMLKFYEHLDMKVWQEDISIDMLDKNEMNEGHRGLTRGITDKYEKAVKIMIQTPQFGKYNTIIGVKEMPFKLVSHKHVPRIRLLNGCPRLYIGRTLAHEMMHAWICLEGYSENVQGFCGAIPDYLEEGVCQVMAHTWIESKIHSMSRNKSPSSSGLRFERKLAKHIKYRIEMDPRHNYGDGFRKAKSVVDRYGLKGTLDYIRLTGSFPK